MVRKKRIAVKDEGDAEKVEPTPVLVVEEPKPTLSSSEETAWKLLDSAPPAPYIVSVEDAVKFVEKYERWLRDVKGTKR